jgi:hypothetical protein
MLHRGQDGVLRAIVNRAGLVSSESNASPHNLKTSLFSCEFLGGPGLQFPVSRVDPIDREHLI